MSESMVDYALRYARAGRRVIPLHTAPGGRCSCGKIDCASPGKHPRTERGAHDASSDEAVIRAWWARWPDANIGMTLEDHVVVDEDPRNGGDVSVLPYKLPETCNQKTGGGGRHFLYRARNGTKYPGHLAPGVDCKSGPGAYIVVEPSVHASGGKYCWLDETEPWSMKPAAAPEWLAPDERPAAAPAVGASIGEGGRNATLASLAGTMRRRGMEQPAIEAALLAENRAKCTPPLADAEVRAIAASVARYAPARAPAPGWPLAQDIFRDFVAAPYSPDDVPERVARFARAFSSSTGFDRSAAIVAAVGAAAAVIDDRYRLAVRHGAGWFESARLWFALIGGPSAGKSPTIRSATDPIKHLHREEWERWQAEKQADKRKRKKEKAEDEAEGKPEPSLFTSDCTLEALSEALKANPRGILMLTEEFASWIGSIDAYRNGQGSRDRGEMLQLYDGGPHQIHRVKRGSFLVPNWGASVIAAGTPAGLRQQVKQLPDDGLIHRFIPCIMRRPEPLSAATLTQPLEDWGRVLRRLYRDTYTPETQQRARLTPAAAAAFEAEAARIREAVADVETVSPALASHLGKHPGMIARVALTFHLLIDEGGNGGEVAPSTVEMACRFLRTARKHAVTLFTDILQASPVRELARSVARSIAATQDAPAHVSRAWLSSHCRQFRDAPDHQRRAAVEFLEDANWISPAPDSRTYGAWATSSWALNPGIWERFSEVGAEHARRRASVRGVFLGGD